MSRLATEICGPPEYNTCRHCQVQIMRWPKDRRPRWVHNPGKGFRLFKCKDRETFAEPMPESHG